MTSRLIHKVLTALAAFGLIGLLIIGLASSASAQLPPQNAPTGTVQDSIPDLNLVNAFTPNGDGINDFFAPSPVLMDYTFWVYDRWGNELYLGNQSNPWNGLSNGSPAAEGVYIYRMEARLPDGSRLERAATFTLLR